MPNLSPGGLQWAELLQLLWSVVIAVGAPRGLVHALRLTVSGICVGCALCGGIRRDGCRGVWV